MWIQYAAMFIFVFHVAPTGAPRDVTPSMTSRSIMVTWDTIECTERNGIINGYTVVLDGAGFFIHSSSGTMDRTFFAIGLTPFTNYTFQVAGFNAAGIGSRSLCCTYHYYCGRRFVEFLL